MFVSYLLAYLQGGVLFIDEAYCIVKNDKHQKDSFGKEAIETIMKHLDPPACVFIFAGYEQPMEDFIRVNDGHYLIHQFDSEVAGPWIFFYFIRYDGLDIDIFFDIGANVGYATCLFLELVPGSKVVAVEPQPDIADLFRINAQQFRLRTRLIEAGLWDLPGSGWLVIDKSNRGASKVQDAQSDAATKVPLLDAAAFFATLKRVDLIKIDIEGAEVRVLEAAKAELARLRPRAILFEDHHVFAQSAPEDAPIPRLMHTLGYECFAVQKTLFSTKLVPLAKAKRLRTHDFLAVRR